MTEAELPGPGRLAVRRRLPDRLRGLVPAVVLRARARRLASAGAEAIHGFARNGSGRDRALVAALAAHGAGAARPDARGVAAAAAEMLRSRIVELPAPELRRDALIVAAAAQALGAERVHVACQTEAIAARHFAAAEATLGALGLRGALVADDDVVKRRQDGYRAAVVFASAARLAQDALRDHAGLAGRSAGLRGSVTRLARRAQSREALLPEGCVALVDDADLSMIEALRPVRLAEAEEAEAGRLYAEQAFQIISALRPGVHYSVDPTTRHIALSEAGQARIATYAALFREPWTHPRWRERTILAALTVRDMFEAGAHYSVEADEIRLARPVAPVEETPSIPDLLAAKEGLGPGVRAVHMRDTRRLFLSYRVLGGAGVALGPLAAELREIYGTGVRAARFAPAPPVPRLFAGRAALLLAAAPELESSEHTLIWAPTREDAADVPAEARPRVRVGTELFGEATPVRRLVQLGAAGPGWELRARLQYPDAFHLAHASPEDGLFRLLDDDDRALRAFRRVRSVARYRAAQAARSRAAAAQRRRQMASEAFFDRILGFVGD